MCSSCQAALFVDWQATNFRASNLRASPVCEEIQRLNQFFCSMASAQILVALTDYIPCASQHDVKLT